LHRRVARSTLVDVDAISVDGHPVFRRSWWSLFGRRGEKMRTRHHDTRQRRHPLLKKATFVLAAAISGTLLAAAPAAASNAGTTVHISIELLGSGLSLSCGTTVLTPTGGTATLVLHESTDARGIFHLTGTGTLNRATLQDAAGNRYSVTGANRFGGSAYDPDGNEPIAFTSTDKFVIRTATGGVYGMVNVTEHISPSGKYFAFDFGNCSD
jgi:hypothetical protein